MSIQVKLNNLGVSARKVGQVCDLVRGKKASEALTILRFCEKKEISLAISKLINSALAIASTEKKHDLDTLKVSTIFTGEGASLKRVMPRAQGRAYRIKKRTSNVVLELAE